jgi:hypothetical protein
VKTVEVQKASLVETLEENKADHIEEFEEAWEAYSEKLVNNLETMLEVAKSGRAAEVRLHINLVRPENHEVDYERAIQMLKWEVNDTVELREDEFANLVQDDWGWAQSFATSYTSNTGKLSKHS